MQFLRREGLASSCGLELFPVLKRFCVVVVEESLTSLESLAQSGGVVVSSSRLVVVY